jgi:hypothetical protein
MPEVGRTLQILMWFAAWTVYAFPTECNGTQLVPLPLVPLGIAPSPAASTVWMKVSALIPCVINYSH